METPEAQRSLSEIDVCQAAGPAHVTGLNLLLFGETHWLAGFEGHPNDAQGHSLVALRTIDGAGELTLDLADGVRRCELGPGSLILFDDVYLTKYHVIHDHWHTHWYDFVADDRAPLPFHQPWEVPPDDSEFATFQTIRSEIVSRDTASRRLCPFRIVAAPLVDAHDPRRIGRRRPRMHRARGGDHA